MTTTSTKAQPEAIQPGDAVRRRHPSSPRLAKHVGRVVKVWTSDDVGAGKTFAKVRFVGTWARMGGGRGDALLTIETRNLVKVDPTPSEAGAW